MKTNPESSLRIGVLLGFALIFVLMVALALVGLQRLSQVNQHIEQIVHNHNVKTELAHTMKDALRERAVIMHSMTVLNDPFAQDDEYLRFNEWGTAFSTARTTLEAMPLSSEEREILARMRTVTARTQPRVVQAVDLAMRGAGDRARQLIEKEIIGPQKLLAGEISKLLDLQKAETRQAVNEALASYANTRWLMILLGAVVGLVSLAIAVVVIRNANKQAGLLQHQAMFDSLTRLPNRALFADRLQQAILVGRRDKQPFALIAMDLDRFKEINDSLGHHTGDRVLQVVAERTRRCLRESDTVARMGGDEFTILLATLNGEQGAVTVARKILAALAEPFEAAGQTIEIGASLGIALFPEHGEEAELLQREADTAMYAAKQGMSGYKVYTAELGHGADDRIALQGDLRRAIAGHELVLHYQPKIDLAAGCITGVEALVRWQHPRHGLLAPDQFIPLAEQSGLIKPLTLSVLRTALLQCQQWQQSGLRLTVSVNISTVNIQDPEFPEQVAGLLKEIPVPPELLELEVTETAVMSEPQRAVECIRRLSALGLQVAIDDFGTGYSSMAYLKELLVAKIKIDKSFVRDMAVNHSDAVIVRSTVELGHNLGLKVVAEGVENQNVWDRLKDLGCDAAQGYYMSRPLPADKFSEWLGESPWGLAAEPVRKLG